jgi:hypothetical protein
MHATLVFPTKFNPPQRSIDGSWWIAFSKGGDVFLEDWKTKVSTLWLMNEFSMVTMFLFGLFETGDLTHLVPPIAVNSTSLLLVSLALIADVAMAFLSQSLANNMNRWLNIIVGAAYGIGALVALVGMLMWGSVLAILSAAGFLWMVLVVWLAWKSK